MSDIVEIEVPVPDNMQTEFSKLVAQEIARVIRLYPQFESDLPEYSSMFEYKYMADRIECAQEYNMSLDDLARNLVSDFMREIIMGALEENASAEEGDCSDVVSI